MTDRGSEDVLEYCEQHDIVFIPWFPLAAGQLAGADSPIRRVAAQKNLTPSQVALAWLLARSPVILPIPGTSKVAHVLENVAAARVGLTEEDINAVNQTLPLDHWGGGLVARSWTAPSQRGSVRDGPVNSSGGE